MKLLLSPSAVFILSILSTLCSASGEVPFRRHLVVPEGADKWWARSHADVNGDGLLDFYVIHNNATGGWLGYYLTQPGLQGAARHLIAEEGPEGGTFGAGDLASGDIDGDGDIDVIGPVHPGEWANAGAPCDVYWYENPSWEPHAIGRTPTIVKDFDLVDLNGDGKLDLVGTCFGARSLIVFRQDSPKKWTQVANVRVPNLHEGQHVGDVDGDGDLDVVSTAYWFVNPGGSMTGEWKAHNIDPYWNSDEGRSWEHNSTKMICADIDGDDKDEVFISCSEKFRDRVAWYDLVDAEQNRWDMFPIGSNTFAHTLQVGDMDNDGDLDVLSGNNAGQGDPQNSPVYLFLNQGDNKSWTPQLLTKEGAYNSYLGDIEGDGDLDFFRYPGHESTFYELWLNLTEE